MLLYINEKFKDTKGVISGRKSKDRQYDDQKKGTEIKMQWPTKDYTGNYRLKAGALER